jgi:predicted dehydrogenase
LKTNGNHSFSGRSPIPIGVVGLNFGRHLIDHLSAPELRQQFQVAAVCDLDRDKAVAMGDRLGVKAYDDLDDLLGDSNIPVVGLFTAPSGRAALLRRIFHAGKDVITTKPFEDDPALAEEILEEACRLRRVVHLNSPTATPPYDILQIKRWIERYDLGRPVAARGDVWVSYREKADGSWYDDVERCPVAPIFRLGIYLINDLVAIFGAADEVLVQQSRLFTERPTADNAQLGIRFKNGALANIFASFCVQDSLKYRNSLTINFERGTIFRNVGAPDRASAGCVELTLVREDSEEKRLVNRKKVPLGSGFYQWNEFRRALQRRESPSPAFIRELVDGLRIVEAMKRAAQTGIPAKVESGSLLETAFAA